MAPRSPAVYHWRWRMELHHPLAHRDQRNLQHVPAVDLGAAVALIRAHQLQHHHRHQKRGAHPSRHSTEAGYAKESFARWAGGRGLNKAKHRCCAFSVAGLGRPKSVQPSVKPSFSKDRCVLAVPVLYNHVGRGVLRWLGGVRWCVRVAACVSSVDVRVPALAGERRTRSSLSFGRMVWRLVEALPVAQMPG